MYSLILRYRKFFNVNFRKQSWYLNRFRHRKNNRPAVIWSDDYKEYWIDGENYFIRENGTREFYAFGVLNREDNLPAIEYSNGDKEWWIDGKRHRLDGPAVIYGNKQFWFEYGEFIKCSNLL